MRWLVYLIGVILILGGIGVFLYQCYFWLKNGAWLEIPLVLPVVLGFDIGSTS